MDVAAFEVADAGAEDEVRRTLDIAVLVVVALDTAELAITAVGVQGVLVAYEAAAVEEKEVSVGENRHSLTNFLALT